MVKQYHKQGHFDPDVLGVMMISANDNRIETDCSQLTVQAAMDLLRLSPNFVTAPISQHIASSRPMRILTGSCQ